MPKSRRLTLDFPADLPRLEVNAAQIRQVVMNLVLNASEALTEQNGLITIAARREHLDSLRRPACWSGLPDGEYVCLEVSDTGVGMTEEVRMRIFDPFFTTKIEGRGLGLAAVQGIVRSHGGAIYVASTPGKGSTFRILLPCDNRVVRQLPLAKASLEPVPIQRTFILVVEDDDTLRLAVSRILLKKGYAVLEASSGNLAIEQIRAQKQEIGVVLLDLNLPGRSSVEVFEELQRTRPGVKVILTSAYGRESITGSLKALRHESFLRKPYHLNELVTAVRNSLPPGKLA